MQRMEQALRFENQDDFDYACENFNEFIRLYKPRILHESLGKNVNKMMNAALSNYMYGMEMSDELFHKLRTFETIKSGSYSLTPAIVSMLFHTRILDYLPVGHIIVNVHNTSESLQEYEYLLTHDRIHGNKNFSDETLATISSNFDAKHNVQARKVLLQKVDFAKLIIDDSYLPSLSIVTRQKLTEFLTKNCNVRKNFIHEETTLLI